MGPISYTRMEMLARAKYSSFLGQFVTYEETKCCEYGSWNYFLSVLVSFVLWFNLLSHSLIKGPFILKSEMTKPLTMNSPTLTLSCQAFALTKIYELFYALKIIQFMC